MNSRDDAIKNDLLIQDLAIYELSKGTTRTLQKEDLNKVQNLFSEYKRLIRTGEFTYDELCERVYGKWGITKPLVKPLPPPPNVYGLPDANDLNAMSRGESLPSEQEALAMVLGDITKLLGDPVNIEPKEPEKPYPWYKRILDKIKLLCSRFYVNI